VAVKLRCKVVKLASTDGEGGMYDVFKKGPGLDVEAIRARVWVPAGFTANIDHSEFRSYYLPVSALEAADWALLLSQRVWLP
jgi:hypothetical protein